MEWFFAAMMAVTMLRSDRTGEVMCVLRLGSAPPVRDQAWVTDHGPANPAGWDG